MIRTCFLLLLILFSLTPIFSQENVSLSATEISEQTSFSDGPYVFIEKDRLVKKEIINGEVVTYYPVPGAYETEFTPDREVYTKVKKIAALSDIHGRYDLAIQLLKVNKIIDSELNWNFGRGHLVIVGDIFDRGDKVNEMLWLVYDLERQARARGGHVHFLLGNHEYMVLHKDLRYLHEKYVRTQELLEMPYDELYGRNTVLGRWLRSKPTIIKINNHVFVHGGVSKNFLNKNEFDIVTINDIMRSSIDRTKDEMKSTDFYKTYYGKNSLIWYRGYFNDDLKHRDIDEVLEITKSEHIVVGHCSNKEVVSLFDNKIFGVDSSIKNGKYGELLMIRKDQFYRMTPDGRKLELKPAALPVEDN
jgi:hypothetical protein